VRRARGGAFAGPATGHADIPYKVKRIENRAAKQAIGRFAATLVGSSESVLLDAGSTTFEVARALLGRHDVSVMTNDLNVAMCLSESPRMQLVVTVGILLESVYTRQRMPSMATIADG
jgi:DeoR/GlpR family transcriptional regulator of sugar metabolism